MIDGQGQQPPPVRPRPIGGETKQGHGIAPARQGQSHRLNPPRIKPGLQPGEDPAGQALGALWRQLQFARVRSCVARVFCAAVAVSA